jgi:TPR repeat protein
MGVKNLLSLLNTVTETEKKVDPIDQFNKYKSKANNNVKAQFNLACCYYNATGCEKNLEKVFEYLLLSSNNGNINALFSISQMYYNGIHFEKNLNEAFNYCKKAADFSINSGEIHEDAIFNLACYYYNGEGIIINHEQAIKYFNYLKDDDIEVSKIISKLSFSNNNYDKLLKEV